MINLKTDLKWLLDQARSQRVVLFGKIEPEIHDSFIAHAFKQALTIMSINNKNTKHFCRGIEALVIDLLEQEFGVKQ
jgi:hypothetical protein